MTSYKLYQQCKKSVAAKVPGLDLETLENGAHFFSKNVFKYTHALTSSDGYVFGELGILNKKVRSATVVCLEDCYFATLTVKKYEQILMKQENMQLAKKRNLIMSTLISSGNDNEDNSVSVEKMSKISYYFHKRKFQAGEVMFREDEPVKHIFLIKKGEVELQKEVEVGGSKDFFKGTIRVSKLTARQFFGDCDVHFSRGKRFYTAVATATGTLYYCDVQHFLKCIEEFRELTAEFASRVELKHSHRMEVIAEATHTRNFVKDLQGLMAMSKKKLKNRAAAAVSKKTAEVAANEEKQ